MRKYEILIIVLMIISTGVLSGCEQLSGETKIADINAHPNNYINKVVTIRGKTYSSSVIGDAVININIPSGATKPTPFVEGAEYKVTGVVRYGNYNLIYNGLYLDVTKIETT